MEKKIIQIQTAFNSEEEVRRIANKLIEMNLAACVQFFPITSIYRWKEQIEESKEYLLFIKSTLKNKNKIMEFLEKEHTYELPEIVVTSLDYVSKDYSKWVDEETN
ncbi:MAG: divalent-cation tolerance protein CutA [Candidatus Heimdallarchaeota archaeon]|nr:divalent-cation tolerance protein CutA [Candidatus Heimdallarchaeota archaeon]MCK4769722.1 divalent-cation tolerance protein CutA [Candidatus Heimdallarchaeota archaeon]